MMKALFYATAAVLLFFHPLSALQAQVLTNPQLFSPSLTTNFLKKFMITIPPSCIGTAVNAPDKTIATICRRVGRCVTDSSGRSAADVYFDQCWTDLPEGEARQLWDDLGTGIPENELTTSQLRNEISSGRVTVNIPAFCACMNSISALTCEQVGGMISNPFDFGNMENLIPETPSCQGAFTGH